MATRLQVRREVIEKMLAYARAAGAMECCGLLAGQDGVITTAFPARNAKNSATEFEIAPVELFQLFRKMREDGLEHLGIYHSHPAGSNAPSRTDIENAFYPEAAYFVISPARESSPAVRAFSIREGKVRELLFETI